MNRELEVGIEAVLIAGAAIRRIYSTDFTVRMKAKDDPVTEADMQAHSSIAKHLKSHFPEDVLLSEEDIPKLEDRLSSNRVWILDPLDGTRDFVARNPEFAISLGLVIQNQVRVGIVYNPVTEELFWGVVGGRTGYSLLTNFDQNIDSIGSYILRNKNIFNIKKQSRYDDKILILVSNTEMKQKLYEPFLNIPSFSERYNIVSKGSIAYKLGLFAKQEADLVLSLKPKNEWDICAGIAILESMGYKAFDIKMKKSYVFNQKDTLSYGLLAGSPDLVDELWATYKDQLQSSLKNWY